MKLFNHVLACSLILVGCQQQPGQTTYPASPEPVASKDGNPPPASPSTPVPASTPKPLPKVADPKPAKLQGKLEPLPGAKAPKLTKAHKVRFKTTQGELLIEVYPEAAPNAAKRFVELVALGFYDKTPIFRVVPGFVCQFGVNSKPGYKEHKDNNFQDDPSHFKLSPGTLAFAKAGPNTNSTQIFINYGDNSQLASDANGHFSTFAKVVKGYEHSEKFKALGDPSMGLDQQALWFDTAGYLKSLPEQPDMIEKAEVLP